MFVNLLGGYNLCDLRRIEGHGKKFKCINKLYELSLWKRVSHLFLEGPLDGYQIPS